jgi:hypothetical protein
VARGLLAAMPQRLLRQLIASVQRLPTGMQVEFEDRRSLVRAEMIALLTKRLNAIRP